MESDNLLRGHVYGSPHSSGNSLQFNGDRSSTNTGDTNLTNIGNRSSSIRSGDDNSFVTGGSIRTQNGNSTYNNCNIFRSESVQSSDVIRQNLQDEIIDAATEGDSVRLSSLLEANRQLKAKERWGDLALRGAIKEDHPECVEIMLERGVSREKEDENGLTPLMYAAKHGLEAVAKALLNKNPDLAASMIGTKWTALMLAASYNQLAVLGLLLATGPDLEVGNSHDRTALMLAALEGHAAVVEALLDAGAKIDRRDLRGNSALMLAAEKNQDAVVRLLLQRGADVNATTNRQETALLLAVGRRHRDTAQLLLEAGADLDVNNQDGDTTMDLAVHDDMVQLIKMWKARRMQTPAPSLKPPTLDTSETQVSPATLPPEGSSHNTVDQGTTYP